MDLKKLIDREIWSMNESAPLNEEVYTLYHGSPYEFHKFSLNNIGTGEGLDKFGHGLYFTDSKEKAAYYANELSIGDHKKTGFNIYQVRVNGDFLNWDEEIPSDTHDRVVNGLIRLGYDSEADTMQREKEEYGTYWTMDSLYQFLSATLPSRKEVSEFLVDCHVDGVFATNRAYVGNVYVSFRDDNVKIIQTMKVGDEDEMYGEGHIVENVQQLDKELLKTNKITPEDKENILSITNGDNYTFIVGFFYAWLFNPTAPAYDTQEKRNAQFRGSHYNRIFREFYESVRTYNKNVFPIKNFDITLKNIHPIELIGGLQARDRILSFLKKIPSLYTRNLAADIRIPREESELKYDVETQINRIKNGLQMVDRLSDDKKEVIYKKIFSSNNKTFKQVADQLEKTEVLFLSHDDAEDEVRTKVENLDGEAEVLYDENNIMVVDIRSSDAMKTLGCGSQWCFATEYGVDHWHNYASNSHVNIVYNFNEEPDSKTRMVVVLPTGEVYNMYNEYMDGADGMDGWEYLESIGISDVTNANVVNDSYLVEYSEVGTTFDVQKFDSLNSFSKRKQYADQTLEKLGSGSARIVYKIDNDKILKLAKNAKGLDQNREECGLGQDHYFKDILTEVFDCHTDDLWIISELARKVSPAKFRQLVGVDIKHVEIYLRNKEQEHRGGKSIFGIDPKIQEQLSENMFVQDLLELMYSYEVLAGDLGRISSYGIVTRDGQESVVLADYGLTKDVYNNHYAPKGYRFEGRNINEDYFDEPAIADNGRINKPVFSIGGLSESLENYRNVSDAIVKQTSKYIENLTNIVRPSNGKELSKLFRLYLIGSQNVERALKFSENDIEFYNNLLKVQDILKKFGLLQENLVYSHVSDASPESDKYQIVNEDVAGFEKSLADEISMKAAEKLGMPLPYFLGEGGFGYAYQSGDKVIKVTKDQSEAVENLKLKGKRFARIAETYGVYATEYKTTGENSIYIIVLEKLNTANAQQLYFRLSQILENDFGESLDDVMETFHYYGGQKWEMKYEEIEYFLTDEPEVKDFFDQFIEIAKEAKQVGIESQDYMNKYNLGYKRDGKLAFFDVGFGQYDFNDEKPELLHVKEDGTSLYTDEHGTVNERIVSFMPNSKTVDVKKKCQLGGNGDGTSTACNQGDVNNFEIQNLKETYNQEKIFYHGSTDKNLAGKRGIHVGTKLAATQALQARIGVPSEGEWDGTRKYGETLLAGKKRLKERNVELGYFVETGYNVGADVPEEDYLPSERTEKAKYSDGTSISLDARPIVFPVKIIGKMTNTPEKPHSDTKANSMIVASLRKGNAKSGYYYLNDGEDSGSISAVVPDSSFLKIVESKMYESNKSLNESKNRWQKLVNRKWNEMLQHDPKFEEYKNTNTSIEQKEAILTKNGILKYGNIEENMMVEANILTLNDLPFKEDIEGMGGKIYSVGGAVRDEFLGKESKDLDILITGVPFDHLEELLAHYGKVDAVGKSFGILKFKPHGSVEDIDIAIPRTERATGEGGHKGFEVSSDHNLPIEKDLERRDFTINAIAKDTNGHIIDPFGGQKDLQRKIIRIVNPEAFSDDPLRMLRAVQFAARFGFVIEPKTKQMISSNAARIKEIPAERILTELDKIVKKGDVLYGADLLRETGLYEQIFGSKPSPEYESWWDLDAWDHVKTLGEYVFLLSYPAVDKPSEFYKTNLKGDIPTQKEISALDIAYSENFDNPIKNRIIVHNMYSMSPASLDSGIVSPQLKRAIQELKSGKYPKGLKELAINGNDLMQLGLKGKELGNTLKSLLVKVYSDKVKNTKEELLRSLSLGQQ